MPIFRYIVRDEDGKQLKGTIEEKNREAAAEELEEKKYTIISLSRIREKSGLESFLARFKKLKLAERNTFSRQLLTLIKAGLPLISSLDAIRKQIDSELLKQAISDIIKDIEGGASFSESLGKHPHCFDQLYVNMVKAGEEGGILDETLERLAELGEHEYRVHSNIKKATRYPILVVCALVLAFTVLVIFVLPRYVKIFSRFDTQLPLPTRILIGISHLIINYWYIILLIIAGLIFGFFRFINTKKGRRIWDNIKIKTPVLGDLFLKLSMSRFTKTTAALMATGIPILRLIDLVIHSTGNKVIEEALADIKKGVIEGKNMAEPIRDNPLFPPIVYQMIAIGEETGKLDELLFKVSEYYDSETDYIIDNLTSLIEPFLLLILGSGVLFIALSIFLPMWNLMALFR
jgi:type II secretory pathway component PulF